MMRITNHFTQKCFYICNNNIILFSFQVSYLILKIDIPFRNVIIMYRHLTRKNKTLCLVFIDMYIGIITWVFLSSHISCMKHDYLLFENFELTKKTFHEEQTNFRIWEEKRNQLRKVVFELGTLNEFDINVQSILQSKKRISDISKIMPQVAVNVFQTSDGQAREQQYIRKETFIYNSFVRKQHNHTFSYQEVYKDWKMIEVVKAALRGLLMLRETFDQNITDFSTGHFSVKTRLFTFTRQIDSLTPEDIASLSKLAFNEFNYYDSAIEYLKSALDMLRNTIGKKHNVNSKKLEEQLSSMRNTYPTYHNELLEKHKNPIGPDWKLYPYKVDEGTRENLIFLIQKDTKIYHECYHIY